MSCKILKFHWILIFMDFIGWLNHEIKCRLLFLFMSRKHVFYRKTQNLDVNDFLVLIRYTIAHN